MSVGRICVRSVDLADPTEPVWQAAERMRQRGVGTLLIVDEWSKPIGIVTDRDLVLRVLAEGLDCNTTLVRDVMTSHPKTIFENAPIEDALAIMRVGGFRRVPVVDTEEKLVGLVSLDDILMLLASEFTQIGKLVERETPRGIAEQV